MKVAVDTNVLVRVAVCDDEEQARAATEALENADIIVISLPCLCEFVWVLRKVYHFIPHDISAAIRALTAIKKVEVDRQAVDAGLAIFAAGGDFADGVMAYSGAAFGAATFISFDKKAVSLLLKHGYSARLIL